MVPHVLYWVLLTIHVLLTAVVGGQQCSSRRFPPPPSSCGCSVSRRGPSQPSGRSQEAPGSSGDFSRADMALIPAGQWHIRTDKPVLPQDGESPAQKVKLDAFWIDKFEVSRRQFAEFVASTGYVTEAETFGNSFVLQSLLSPETLNAVHQAVADAPWWLPVTGANWSRPLATPVTERSANEPAVHVSWNDADKFCRWKSKRLPSEAEWEVACRGGLKERLFPWGNKERPRDRHRMNIWQGKFPDGNSAEDGFKGLAPVDAFGAQNKFGLYNIVGNVWEWTSDWWDGQTKKDKVKKGGSFMCHKTFCYRYRCAARGFNTPDTSSINVGFRCVADV